MKELPKNLLDRVQHALVLPSSREPRRLPSLLSLTPLLNPTDVDGRASTIAAKQQLAGAFYGYSGIPAEWRNKIALKGLIEAMAEELFDMSNRIDPCPPPVPPASSVPPTSGTADAVAGGATHAMPTTEPPEQRVTRFVVKPATDEAGGGGVDGNKGRAGGAFWGGGVAAHYQRLEDAYV